METKNKKEGFGTLAAIIILVAIAELLVMVSIWLTPILNHLIWGSEIVK